MKSLRGTAAWTASSTLFKIVIGLLLVKLFAVQFGATGLGQAANFMTLITVLGAFSGAGIFNGVTKYVAEYEASPDQLAALLSTANRMIVVFSGALAIVFVIFSTQLSQWLFYRPDYQMIVVVAGVAQFGIACSNYFLAILKGYRAAQSVAISLMAGTALGFLIFLCSLLGGYEGALIGLVMIPALTFLPAYFFLEKRLQAVSFWENFTYFPEHGRNLLKFSAMVTLTAITLPVAHIWMRDLLVEHHSLEAVGLWQGVSKISDAYLQLITAVFSVYLLPTFSTLTDKKAIQFELGKALKFVCVLVIWVSLSIFAIKRWLILTLYSRDFLPMEPLFLWQLLGDVFKVMAYVFGYLVVAKASLKLYAVAELTQFALLVVSAHFLIPLHGALGAAQSYFITYLGYFLCCLIGFRYYMCKK